eukprot:COSAG06_NODE_19135_length_852_cov_0.920319_2_plen_193_part_01
MSCHCLPDLATVIHAAVPCGKAPLPDHVPDPQGDSIFYPNGVTRTCDQCYSAGTKSLTFTCQANGRFDHTKEDLRCQAVSCGQVPPKDPHSVGVHWEGEKKCSEPAAAGTDPHRDFSAKCNSGWTGGSKASGNVEQHLTCKASGEFSDPKKLECLPVPCDEPVLPKPASSVPGLGCKDRPDGCPSNVIIPSDC